MRLRLVVLSFIALLTGLTGHSLAAGDEKIRLIQYNVKGSENGWVTGSPNITYKLNLISDVIMNNSVDFITLEEADKKDGDVPSPLLSDELKVQGVSGWKTISSSCNKDVVQISYSSQWSSSLSWDLVATLRVLAGQVATGVMADPTILAYSRTRRQIVQS